MKRTGKYYIWIAIFLLIAGTTTVCGQLGRIMGPSDTLQVDELYREAVFLSRQKLFTQALNKAEQALQLSMQRDNQQEPARIMELMADIYMRNGDTEQALPYYIRTSDLLREMGDTASLVRVYSSVARLYHLEHVYSKELEYHHKVLGHYRDEPAGEILIRRELSGLAAYRSGTYPEAISTFRDLLEIAGPLSQEGIQYRQYLVSAYDGAGQYDHALQESEALITVFESSGNLKALSDAYNDAGYYRTLTGDTEGAVLAYESAINYAGDSDVDPGEVALMKTNAGICYANLGNHRQAITQLRQAVVLFDESGNDAEQSRIQNIIANLYFETGDLYNAGQFSLNAINSAKRSGNRERESEAYLTYSSVLREGNDPDNALVYYEKYLVIRDSIDMARQFRQQQLNQRRIALEEQERNLQLRLREEEVTELAMRQLMLQNEKMEQERELLMQDRNLQLLKEDSLRQSLIILQQQAAVSETERQNKILAQQNELAELRVEQEQQKQLQLQQENDLLEQQQRADQLELERNQLQSERDKRQKRTLYGSVALLLILVLSVLAGLISSRRKNAQLARQKREIEEKNIDLEMKNEEISTQRDEIEAQRNLLYEQKELIEKNNEEVMKSIEYAKRIQAATLPVLAPLAEHLQEYFILFRPRDIVSGDFYWYAQVEKTTVVTVADCTGHGVPGAFMSLLGVSYLKELVQKEYITHPGVILRRLRKEIINTMGQKGISGEQRDGMDMALVTIHHEEGRLEYAGAYNSLYIVRSADQPAPDPGITKSDRPLQKSGWVLYEIPADKMPIAHYDVMDKFTNYDIQVFKGDKIYLFTDGYADQFGGPKGKKFMYKPFKMLILEHAGQPMVNQEKILSETLHQWQGDHPQVDDICVMGITI